jgi:hypothetical protein
VVVVAPPGLAVDEVGRGDSEGDGEVSTSDGAGEEAARKGNSSGISSPTKVEVVDVDGSSSVTPVGRSGGRSRRKNTKGAAPTATRPARRRKSRAVWRFT